MAEERDLLRGNIPTLILAVVSEGPLYGLAIAREINQRSPMRL
jgi:DNA-binding PadR family transcriptional regulator